MLTCIICGGAHHKCQMCGSLFVTVEEIPGDARDYCDICFECWDRETIAERERLRAEFEGW
jgi:hypothetical protein